MEAINVFFTTNRDLIYFFGGLSFFSMGLASVLQWRRHSRLRLARWLGLLAWFGFLYGLSEWANLLIPLQEPLPVPVALTPLAILQLLVRGLALALLFQFGVELLRPPWRRWHVVRFLPLALVLLWMMALAYLWVVVHAPGDIILSSGDLLARYLLGLPAAVLSCLGLIEQNREVREAGFPHIARYLLGAAISLGVFGLVGVLLAVAGPFFPGEWLSYPSILYTIGVFVPLLRTFDGAAMAFFTGRALEVFEAESEAMLAKVERRNLLLSDRERISRELHDGIIQSLYAAGLRLEDAYRTIDRSPDEAGSKIRGMMDDLNQIIREIRAYIFDLQESRSEGSLVEQLAGLIRELRLDWMLESEFAIHGPRCDVPPERVAHVCQIAQEALSNVVRHAQAGRVQVRLLFSPERLRLLIEDDGRGFVPEHVFRDRWGMGLGTMCERATLLGGQLHVDSQPGGGTRVELDVPCLCRMADCSEIEEAVEDGICTLASADCG